MVTVVCKCGKKKLTRQCHEVTAEVAKARQLAEKSSPSDQPNGTHSNGEPEPEATPKARLTPDGFLPCSGECFEVLPDECYVLYEPETVKYALENAALVKLVEDVFAEMISKKKKIHMFPPMKSPQRKFIHDLAAFYGIETESMDPEPRRSVEARLLPKSSVEPPQESKELSVSKCEKTIMKKKRPKSILESIKTPPKATKIPPHRTQQLISTFHALNKRLAFFEKKNDEAGAEQIRKELEALGGLDAYQKASLRGGDEQKGKGACGRWLVPILKEVKKDILEVGEEKLRMLDVGAVNGETYAKQEKWISVVSIDLNPQHPNIIKQDFFKRPLPNNDGERFHVVCFSLVVNFVPEPAMRGEMLRKSWSFLLPKGVLYLVVPLPCVTNSRYLTDERLSSIMTSLGYEEIRRHFSKKLAHFVYKKLDSQKRVTFKKQEVNPGAGRNNFAIVLE
ncbi:hypothetical protein HDU96_003097 [Phlyctochytrium bullatum]|nr:hypothetical protein HDU96_003097 [Phlyctochytrium bullatum]